MPNLDTHAGIAMHAYPERGLEFAAGEVADDLIRMAGGLPILQSDGSVFHDGLRSNNTVTDPAFDGQPPIKKAIAAMRADIQARELAPIASRLAGPAIDILFSGVSMELPDVSSSYLEVCDFIISAAGKRLVAKNTRPSRVSGLSHVEVCGNVRKIAARGLNPGYADADKVVYMLKRRVSGRGSLALPDDSRFDSSLAEVFAEQQASLAEAVGEIYLGTITTIKRLDG